MASVRFADGQSRPAEFLDFTSRSCARFGLQHCSIAYV
jgi:hypothetical protein